MGPLAAVFAQVLPVLALLPQAAGEPAGRTWDERWRVLGEADPARAFPVLVDFLGDPEESFPYLAARLQPSETPDPDRIRRLIADLDDPRFARRNRADAALRKLGPSVAAALRRALENPDSLETRLRLVRLLEQTRPAHDPDERRIHRALQALEHLGTGEAAEILQTMAAGPKSSWRTHEAERCLQRLRSQAPSHTGRARLLHVLQGHTGNVYAAAPSPDGRLLVSGGADGTVRLWDLRTGVQKAVLGKQPSVYALVFSRDGRYVFSGGSSSEIMVWDVVAEKQAGTLTGHTRTVRSLALSPDGEVLASGSYDKTVRLWDCRARKCLATLEGHRGSVYAVAFGPEGETLASGSSDKTVGLWDVAERENRSFLAGHTSNIYGVGFSRDGKTLISCDSSGTVRRWEMLTEKVIGARTRNSGHRYLALPPGGRIAAFGGGGTVILRDLLTGAQLGELEGHTMMIRGLGFSETGRILATGSYDDTIRVWELEAAD